MLEFLRPLSFLFLISASWLFLPEHGKVPLLLDGKHHAILMQRQPPRNTGSTTGRRCHAVLRAYGQLVNPKTGYFTKDTNVRKHLKWSITEIRTLQKEYVKYLSRTLIQTTRGAIFNKNCLTRGKSLIKRV